MGTIQVLAHRCDKCGHVWMVHPRVVNPVLEKPKACAKCKSRKWDTATGDSNPENFSKQNPEKRRGGRVPIAGLSMKRHGDLPVQDLEVGGKATFYPDRCACPFRFGVQRHEKGCRNGAA